MNRRIILTAVGLAAAIAIFLIYRRNDVPHSRSASSDLQGEMQSSRPGSAPQLPKQIGASKTNPNSGRSLRPVSPSEDSALYLRLTESTDPEAGQLFTDCFWLMDNGKYQEARLKLEAFLTDRPVKGNEFMPPAWWMLAWCILNEGGKENLLDAADRFLHYAKMWPPPGERSSVSTAAIAQDYEELAKAAIFNRAVIYADLSRSAHGEERYEHIGNAKEALDSFLEKWPDDPQALEARNLLDSLLGSY